VASGKKKPSENDSSRDLSKRLDRIRNLENEVIELKKSLILESASNRKYDSTGLSFILLHTAGKKLAAPLKYVEEAVEMPALVEIPNRAPSIAGLLNYHGEMIAVVNLDELAGASSNRSLASQMLLICKVENRRFALKIDEALDVITVTEDDITISDKVLPGILQSSGILKTDDNQTALIVDLTWIAVGSHLGRALGENAAIPVEQ